MLRVGGVWPLMTAPASGNYCVLCKTCSARSQFLLAHLQSLVNRGGGALLLAARVAYPGSSDASESSDDWEGTISRQTAMTGSQLLPWA